MSWASPLEQRSLTAAGTGGFKRALGTLHRREPRRLSHTLVVRFQILIYTCMSAFCTVSKLYSIVFCMCTHFYLFVVLCTCTHSACKFVSAPPISHPGAGARMLAHCACDGLQLELQPASWIARSCFYRGDPSHIRPAISMVSISACSP